MASYPGTQVITVSQVKQLSRTIRAVNLVPGAISQVVNVGQEFPALSGHYLVS